MSPDSLVGSWRNSVRLEFFDWPASQFEAPFFVFATGFVCGHVFGYAKPIKPKD